MLHETPYYCPECDEGIEFFPTHSRRDFMRVVGSGTAAAMAAAGSVPAAFAGEGERKQPAAKPAEGLIRELHATLSPEQKQQLVLPWDHGSGSRSGKPSRLRTYNSAVLGKRIGQHYTDAQQELVRKILRSILSSDEAYERITRYGKWDGSRSFEGNGAVIFGNPAADEKFAWVFAGHHLTVRCDGNSQPGAAFGGPMYYGHILNGYSEKNVYNYQTRQVQAVFDALDSPQQEKAIAAKNPGDRERGIQFPPEGTPKPGIGYAELKGDQQALIEKVMRVLLEPFRQQDADEVMTIIKSNGGMEKIHLAFYEDARARDGRRWHFWRLQGPGFIWNYRVLPHVHCYVNIIDTSVT